MHSWTWRAIVFGALLTVLIFTATRPDPETAGLSSASSSQLVDLLGSSRDVVRRSAAAKLLAQGTNAVPALVNAIPEADEHALNQIFMVLEDLYVSSDEDVADAAEDALEQLASSSVREVRYNADQVFQSNMSRRHMRAYAKIESFGGRFVSNPSLQRDADPHSPLVIAVIPAEWTGGEPGLKYFRRILPVLMAVHVETEAPVSDEAIQRLTRFVSVRRQHEACLGVELQERSNQGLMIRRLVFNSPAALAKLEREDQIVEFAGEPIGNYFDFINQLRRQHPGDEIDVVVRRGDAMIPVSVTLGSDFGTGHCRCQGDEAEAEAPSESSDDAHGRSLPTSDRVSPVQQDHFGPRHRLMPRTADALPGR